MAVEVQVGSGRNGVPRAGSTKCHARRRPHNHPTPQGRVGAYIQYEIAGNSFFARDAFIGASGIIYREFAAAVPEAQALTDRAMARKGP
jgi:hypothetical protein